MAAKFHSKRTVVVDSVTVEIGRKSNAPAFKIHLPNAGAVIVDEAYVNSLADALDDTLDIFESDPLLWRVDGAGRVSTDGSM